MPECSDRSGGFRGLAEVNREVGRQIVELPAGAHMVPLTHPSLLARSLAPHMRSR